MAQTFVVSIYGLNSNAQGTAQGRLMGFPSTGILVRPVIPDSTNNGVYNGVTMNSIIQILPTGLSLGQDQWYTPKTVSEVATLANA